MAGQPTPPGPRTPPKRNKALIAGLIKGNQWLISPDHKAGYFWGGVRGPGGWVDQPLLMGGEFTKLSDTAKR